MRLTPSGWLGCCAGALLLLNGLGLAIPHPAPGQFGIGYGAGLRAFVFVTVLQGLVYFAAVALLGRVRKPPALALILGVAVLLRLMVLVVPPFLSNDMYRYIWDGWVQNAGINPYRYIPADAHLAFLRDNVVFPNINRATYAHTIYPPAAEVLFAVFAGAAKLLAIPPVFGMKLALTGIEGIGILAMLGLLDRAGLPRARILIYAWNPIAVWEFAGSGHVDAIAVCFVALALLAAACSRSALAGAALAAAVLAKFLPAVLAPAMWQWLDKRFAAVFLGVILALYVPYLGAGAGVFGFLGGYTAQEGIDTGRGIFSLGVLGWVFGLADWAPKLYFGLLAALLGGLAWRMVRHPPPATGPARAVAIARRAGVLGGVLMAGLSPHFPWYYPFLLVPACVVPAASLLYLVTASGLLYLNPIHTNLFWPALVYGPFVILALYEAWRNGPARRAVRSPT